MFICQIIIIPFACITHVRLHHISMARLIIIHSLQSGLGRFEHLKYSETRAIRYYYVGDNVCPYTCCAAHITINTQNGSCLHAFFVYFQQISHSKVQEKLVYYIHSGFLAPVLGSALNQVSADFVWFRGTINLQLIYCDSLLVGKMNVLIWYPISWSHDCDVFHPHEDGKIAKRHASQP